MANRFKYLQTSDMPKTPIGEEPGEGSLTPEQEAAIAANTAARHTHSNKAVLDGITAQDLANWNGKANPSDIPMKVSDLQNDSGYQTAQEVQTAIANLQTESITDTGDYYTTDTVDGALQEIGAELAGVNTLIGSGVIT